MWPWVLGVEVRPGSGVDGGGMGTADGWWSLSAGGWLSWAPSRWESGAVCRPAGGMEADGVAPRGLRTLLTLTPWPLSRAPGEGSVLRSGNSNLERVAAGAAVGVEGPLHEGQRAPLAEGDGGPPVGAAGRGSAVRVTGGPDGADFLPAQVPTVPEEAAYRVD